jgi:hypothetical protein
VKPYLQLQFQVFALQYFSALPQSFVIKSCFFPILNERKLFCIFQEEITLGTPCRIPASMQTVVLVHSGHQCHFAESLL